MDDKVKDVPDSGNDEIDLYELFLVLKKRFKLIAGIVISAVLITGVISFLSPPVYRSSFIIRMFSKNENRMNPIISTGEVEKLISELDLLRKEKQLNELSKRLNIKDEQIKKAVKFYAKTPSDDKDLVEITLDIYDRGLIPDLRNGIIQYLNQNPYVNERITTWKDNLLQQKAEIQKKIQEIDGFKNFLISQIKNDRAKYLGFNPLQLDEEVIKLKKELRDLEDTIKLLRGFEVTIEPEIPQMPIRPKKALNIAMAGLVSLFLGISLTFLIEWIDSKKHSN